MIWRSGVEHHGGSYHHLLDDCSDSRIVLGGSSELCRVFGHDLGVSGHDFFHREAIIQWKNAAGLAMACDSGVGIVR